MVMIYSMQASMQMCGFVSALLHAVGTETGMRETFGSTCHGAGRARSRNNSRNKLDYQQASSSADSCCIPCGAPATLLSPLVASLCRHAPPSAAPFSPMLLAPRWLCLSCSCDDELFLEHGTAATSQETSSMVTQPACPCLSPELNQPQ